MCAQIARQRRGLRQSSGAFGWLASLAKAPEDWRTAMSNVKFSEGARAQFFPLEALFVVFPFRHWRSTSRRFPGMRATLTVAPPAIRARPNRERHQLTLAVTAKKRARPISKSGRYQPKCASGR